MTDLQKYHTILYQALLISVCLTFFMLPVGTAPLTLSSLLALAIYLLSGACSRDRADWQGQEWVLPLMVLIILPWAWMLWSSSPFGQSLQLAEKSHYWLFGFVSASAMKPAGSLRYILICFMAGTTVIALMVFLFLNGFIPETAYLQNFLFRSYLTFSLLLVISIVLLAFFYKTSPWPHKLLLLAVMLFLALTITQLKGRSAYLSLALLSPWIFITMFGRRRLIPILAALLLTFMLMFSSRTVRERIALVPKEIKLYQSGVVSSYKLTDGSSIPSSVGLHLQMWKISLEVIKHYPIFGAGTNGFQYEADKLYPGHGFSHPHNSYLYVAASYGLAGMALYGWLLIVTAKRAWRTREHLSGYSILAFLSVILIGSLTDTLILSVAPGILLGFTVGIPTQQSSRQI
jgi:O-antigen ligase